MNFAERQKKITEDFSMMFDDLDRFTYLAALGGKLPKNDSALLDEQNLIAGCQSEVWMTVSISGGIVELHAYSDTMLIRGLLYILGECVNGLHVSEICMQELTVFEDAGLVALLSETRQSGLKSILLRAEELMEVRNERHADQSISQCSEVRQFQ